MLYQLSYAHHEATARPPSLASFEAPMYAAARVPSSRAGRGYRMAKSRLSKAGRCGFPLARAWVCHLRLARIHGTREALDGTFDCRARVRRAARLAGDPG